MILSRTMYVLDELSTFPTATFLGAADFTANVIGTGAAAVVPDTALATVADLFDLDQALPAEAGTSTAAAATTTCGYSKAAAAFAFAAATGEQEFEDDDDFSDSLSSFDDFDAALAAAVANTDTAAAANATMFSAATSASGDSGLTQTSGAGGPLRNGRKRTRKSAEQVQTEQHARLAKLASDRALMTEAIRDTRASLRDMRDDLRRYFRLCGLKL
eukprot:m.211778 g.211778  ORF g.211778 m.211778 type:complete len:216 (+) comp18898_c0_seq1:346-993(+)